MTLTLFWTTITLRHATTFKTAPATPNLLTDLALKALIKSPPDRQTDIPDASSPGLSARVTPRGRITWSLRLRVSGEGGQSARGQRAKGQQYRLTLGTYARELDGYSEMIIADAFARHRRKRSFFPSIAEVFALVIDLETHARELLRRAQLMLELREPSSREKSLIEIAKSDEERTRRDGPL